MLTYLALLRPVMTHFAIEHYYSFDINRLTGWPSYKDRVFCQSDRCTNKFNQTEQSVVIFNLTKQIYQLAFLTDQVRLFIIGDQFGDLLDGLVFQRNPLHLIQPIMV